MKKIVINDCFGGYSISALATKELAKRKGRECFFFTIDLVTHGYTPISVEEADGAFLWYAYSVNNPKYFKLNERDDDGLFKSANERARKISLDDIKNDRSDPDLISVIEQMGEAANGKCSKLKIIEIPDDVEWEIDEYDGLERVAEKHRTWN